MSALAQTGFIAGPPKAGDFSDLAPIRLAGQKHLQEGQTIGIFYGVFGCTRPGGRRRGTTGPLWPRTDRWYRPLYQRLAWVVGHLANWLGSLGRLGGLSVKGGGLPYVARRYVIHVTSTARAFDLKPAIAATGRLRLAQGFLWGP
jgi:hypothetical protein